jgi:hypothetical protein
MDAQDGCAYDVVPTLISIPKHDGQRFPQLCPPMCCPSRNLMRTENGHPLTSRLLWLVSALSPRAVPSADAL